ncbi:hypothetical protein FRC16_002681 [Serendipita sp. 398]|nr:hypothetical protein FRC16_002681 [Serendipita sp. 398]
MHYKWGQSQLSQLDGIENYDIGELLEKSATSRVHLGACRRGRIKGRQVAIRITSRFGANLNEKKYREVLDIERKLHHPAIVSLLSSFETQDMLYEVLELCPRGSLAQFIPRSYSGQLIRLDTDSPILQEPHLRGVLKTVIDAVVYTHQQGYTNFDLRPESILLTSDLCIKLSGFSTLEACKSEHCGLQNDPSTKYKIATDLWNVGVLCFSLVASQPMENLHSDWRLDLPSGISYELRDLLEGLLQPDSADRLPLRRLQSHPFFNPDLPIRSLSDLPLQASAPKSSYLTKDCVPFVVPQLRSCLEVESKRIKSDSVAHSKTRRCAMEVLVASSDTVKARNPLQGTNELSKPLISSRQKLSSLKDSGQTQQLSTCPNPNTIQDTRRLCAGPLPPQALRTPHGTIMIQRNGKVVVDLREGERARGRKGEKVLAISSDGENVEVYYEPHMGVPCLLKEATLITTPQDLPQDCKSMYLFATKYIDIVKRKSPLLVYNQIEARCSIMSNFPNPDIEVCVPNGPSYGKGVPLVPSTPAIRLRMSRQERTIEIATFRTTRSAKQADGSYYNGLATHSSEHVGGEWSKRVLPLANDERIDTTQLSPEEVSAIACLKNFLKLSQVLEAAVKGAESHLTLTSEFCTNQSADVSTSCILKVRKKGSIQEPLAVKSKSLSKMKPRLTGLGLPPRPRRLSMNR